MPLIPNVPFTSGSVFSPEAANAIANPVFDDQTQYLGHLAKIKDVDLDDSATGIKTRVANNELNLKVTAGSGLNAIFAGGRALYSTTVFNINPSSVTLAPSTANYIYVGIDGVVRSTTSTPPIVRALLAIVTTNTTGVLTVLDEREGYKIEVIKPLSSSVRNFGGRGDGGAFVAAGGEVLSDGEYYFTDFTVGAGETITIDKLARIYCTGNVLVAGTINVTQATAGAPPLALAGITLAGGVGSGVGGGSGENPADTYNHLVSPVGSGGGGGYMAGNNPGNGISTTRGGNGGGCAWFEAAGEIRVTGTISAVGTDGANAFALGAVGNFAVTAGAGGGSGGLVLLKSLTAVVISGTINVSGGRGGNGLYSGTGSPAGEDGSGGGGGRLVIFSPVINTTSSTMNLSGGDRGTGFTPGSTNVGAIGGVGGSFGGKGGTQAGNGVAGDVGQITLKYFVPIG